MVPGPVGELRAKTGRPGLFSGRTTFCFTATFGRFDPQSICLEKRTFLLQEKQGQLCLAAEDVFLQGPGSAAKRDHNRPAWKAADGHLARLLRCRLCYCVLLKQVFLTCSPSNVIYSLGVISKASRHDLTLPVKGTGLARYSHV